MVRNNFFKILFTVAMLVAGSITALAQTGAPVGGQVLLNDADGKTTPVVGALVEVYRTDIKAKFPSDKTDKKGYFKFAGLPFGAAFALSISGPGIAPTVFPNVRAGNESIVVNVVAGDGKVLPEDEVRRLLAAGAAATTGAGTTGAQQPAATSGRNSVEHRQQDRGTGQDGFPQGE